MDNPFGPTPKGLTAEWVEKRRPRRWLDFGCGDAELLRHFSTIFTESELRGVDGRLAPIDRAQDLGSIEQDNLRVDVIPRDPPYPSLEGEEFDTITLVSVLEHVFHQHELLTGLYALLSPGGQMLVVVPGKNFLSWLDVGNFKFRFPGLHRRFYVHRHGRDHWLERYGDPTGEFIGDIDARKAWHQHFRPEELHSLVEHAGFTVRRVDGHGLFLRLIILPELVVGPRWKQFVEPLIALDSRLFSSARLVLVAERGTVG